MDSSNRVLQGGLDWLWSGCAIYLPRDPSLYDVSCIDVLDSAYKAKCTCQAGPKNCVPYAARLDDLNSALKEAESHLYEMSEATWHAYVESFRLAVMQCEYIETIKVNQLLRTRDFLMEYFPDRYREEKDLEPIHEEIASLQAEKHWQDLNVSEVTVEPMARASFSSYWYREICRLMKDDALSIRKRYTEMHVAK